MPGVLANVDYGDLLTIFRAREVVIEARRRFIAKTDKLDPEVLADSFYIHYRTPILKNPSSLKSIKEKLWYMIVSTYINSPEYREVSKITKLNSKFSRIMATKVIRVYINMLTKVERNEILKDALESNIPKPRSDKSSSERDSQEHGLSSSPLEFRLLEQEVKTQLSINIGNLKGIDEMVSRVKSLLGASVGHEVAELLLNTEEDSERVKLMNMLRSLIKLVSGIKREYEIFEEVSEGKGIPEGVKKMRSIDEFRDTTPSEQALIKYSKAFFAYKLGTSNLTVRERRLDTKPKLYLLIDKSGSMFYTVSNKVPHEVGSLSKIVWATSIALVLALKGGKIVVRYFDRQAHELIKDKKTIIKTLLTLTPLGGTSITTAIRTAIQDAKEIPKLRTYRLILITDGEDDYVNPETLIEAKKTYRDFKTILVGNDNQVIEKYVSTLKIRNLDVKEAKEVLKSI
ncbi:MAG: VWA containing CoxE family protein [Thermoprotei archaeon ex4572_64]|nr:MAG: VWA containing CoxE family protein [Thermoprotei archaeon ex4572_64]